MHRGRGQRVLSLRDPAVRPRTGAALRDTANSALAGGRQGPPLRATRCPGVGAFTFVELVFVTLLLAILLVSAAPNFRGAWRGLEMERAAVDLAQMLRSARVLAVTRGEPVVWHWEASARRAQLNIRAEAAPVPGRLGRALHLPGAVEIAIVREDEPARDIQFFPDGTSEAAFVTVGEPGHPQYQIEVDGPTSQVFLRKGAPRVPAR